MISDFVKCNNINRLYIVFQSFNTLLDIISRYLFVLNCCSNNKFANAISYRLLLVLGLPQETLLVNLKDFFGHLIKICLRSPRFNIPNNKRFGDRSLFSLLIFICIFLCLLGSLLVSLRLFSKQIKIFLIFV